VDEAQNTASNVRRVLTLLTFQRSYSSYSTMLKALREYEELKHCQTQLSTFRKDKQRCTEKGK
jgi:hypothetical protein